LNKSLGYELLFSSFRFAYLFQIQNLKWIYIKESSIN
jgi:hypothetical protein